MLHTKIPSTITLESIAESIGRLATHDDIKKLPTHDEVHHIVKKAVNHLPTKKDLSDSFDELARMVAVGFRETDKMFVELKTEMGDFKSEVYERFDKVDERFNKVDMRLDGIDLRLDKVDIRLNKVESKL